jgi:Tol biopolymer transport system component
LFSSIVRKPFALLPTLAVGATVLVAGAPSAGASLPGSGQVLTISDGTSSVQVINGTSRTALTNPDGEVMRDPSWSPDGSRLVYLAPDGRLKSLRYTGADTVRVVNFYTSPDIKRASTSWLGDGSAVVWAENWDPLYPRWTIKRAESTWAGSSELIASAYGKHYRNPDGGPGQLVVFQAEDDDGTGHPTGQPAVMLYDGSRPQYDRVSLVDEHGSNPAISPDGRRVAFVRDGQIVTSNLTGGDEVVVTSNAAVHDHPTWSPDGTTIAFSQGTTVAVAPADGSGAATPTVVSNRGGVPAYQPRNRDRVARLSGTNRFDTAAQVSRSHWRTAANSWDQRAQAGAVVLSRSDTFADALGGSALAAAKRGPLLLTTPTGLEATAAAELRRVLPAGGTVYLLGSDVALSAEVETAVRDLGYQPKRLGGANRFSTAVEVAKEVDPDPSSAFLATGMDFPDALAAGTAAGADLIPGVPRGVVVLTNGATLPAASRAYLDSLPRKPLIWGVGHAAAAAALSYDPEALDMVGVNRYDTADYVSQIFFAGHRYAGVATGADWPDALAGGALMGALNGPLLLTLGTATDLNPYTRNRLDETSGAVHTGLVFGGSGVVTDRQLGQVGSWLGGPLGATAVTNPTDVARPAPGTSAAARAATVEAGQEAVREAVEAELRRARQGR